MSRINGDEIEVQRGDKLVPLPERLDQLEKEIRDLKRIQGAVLVVLLVHFLLPKLDLFQTILGLLGL